MEASVEPAVTARRKVVVRWLLILTVSACLPLSVVAQTPSTRPRPSFTWERVGYFCGDDGRSFYVYTSVFPYCQADSTPQEVARGEMAKIDAVAQAACGNKTLDVMVAGGDHGDRESAEQARTRDIYQSSNNGYRTKMVEINNTQYSSRCDMR